MSEVGNEDAGGVLARLMRGANLRRSVEVLKAPDESLAATVSALANTAGGWILIGPDPEDGCGGVRCRGGGRGPSRGARGGGA